MLLLNSVLQSCARRFHSLLLPSTAKKQRHAEGEEERGRDRISQTRLAQPYASQVNFLKHIDNAEDEQKQTRHSVDSHLSLPRRE